MDTIVKVSRQFLLTIIGIILIGSVPFLIFNPIEGKVTFDLIAYSKGIYETVGKIIHFNEITYKLEGTDRALFPNMLDPYFYSLKIIFFAFLISIFIATLITYILMLISSFKRKTTERLIFILESLPDIFVIALVQMFIVWFYQQTEILLFNVASVYGQYAYALPIFCLTILPTIHLLKIMVLLFQDEIDKPYVELAKGKGLSKSFILLVHILRNSLISFFYNSKTIFWFMLSNLLIIEYIFNIYGFSYFLLSFARQSPEILTIGIIMMFIPFFVFFTFGQAFIEKVTNGKVEI
jgi:peptide/nickel transport system permease protein